MKKLLPLVICLAIVAVGCDPDRSGATQTIETKSTGTTVPQVQNNQGIPDASKKTLSHVIPAPPGAGPGVMKGQPPAGGAVPPQPGK